MLSKEDPSIKKEIFYKNTEKLILSTNKALLRLFRIFSFYQEVSH